MKYIEWDEEKNRKLKRERGVSFEQAVGAILAGTVLGKIDHPNQKRYPGQKIYVIEIEEYAFVIPYIEDEKKIFLKTMFPNRKYTKQFIEKGGE
ncbi:MAG: toxin [Candidatus Chisholmbacteria bacterium]|nr:toxin [Candidatus Chisholmbacteria bacterium]